MEELQQKIVGLLQNAGGKMPYPDLLKEMDAFERQSLIRTLGVMRDGKRLHQTVTFDANKSTNLHEVVLGERLVDNGRSV